jgi:hypothetical protein
MTPRARLDFRRGSLLEAALPRCAREVLSREDPFRFGLLVVAHLPPATIEQLHRRGGQALTGRGHQRGALPAFRAASHHAKEQANMLGRYQHAARQETARQTPMHVGVVFVPNQRPLAQRELIEDPTNRPAVATPRPGTWRPTGSSREDLLHFKAGARVRVVTALTATRTPATTAARSPSETLPSTPRVDRHDRASHPGVGRVVRRSWACLEPTASSRTRSRPTTGLRPGAIRGVAAGRGGHQGVRCGKRGDASVRLPIAFTP